MIGRAVLVAFVVAVSAWASGGVRAQVPAETPQDPVGDHITEASPGPEPAPTSAAADSEPATVVVPPPPASAAPVPAAPPVASPAPERDHPSAAPYMVVGGILGGLVGTPIGASIGSASAPAPPPDCHDFDCDGGPKVVRGFLGGLGGLVGGVLVGVLLGYLIAPSESDGADTGAGGVAIDVSPSHHGAEIAVRG